MFFVSDIMTTEPEQFKTPLQQKVYQTLKQLNIPYERVDTDEAITMEDCVVINEKLDMKMVKTLFSCNRQKTRFYLFITTGDKAFDSKRFSAALGVSRVSFATEDMFEEMLHVKIGAATVFSVLEDFYKEIQVVFDQDVAREEYYGCSDGTTTCYMKIRTELILNDFMNHTKHPVQIIEQ